jgi:hypothetical protein
LPKSTVALYYWLTPIFWILDGAFGWNVRAAALEGEPGLKLLYYLFCLGCGGAIWLWPAVTRIVGLTEASVNILLLVLGVLLPYFRLIDQLAASQAIVEPLRFGPLEALSFLFAGAIWVISLRVRAFDPGGR